ncbi:hypothetical protein DNF23_02300 [Pseudomonas syringae pv. pisi]
MRLARRPAEHPPDQRQDSAVTYVAICVVSAIAPKKRFRLCAVPGSKAYRRVAASRALCKRNALERQSAANRATSYTSPCRSNKRRCTRRVRTCCRPGCRRWRRSR